jgi:hypothetical protein
MGYKKTELSKTLYAYYFDALSDVDEFTQEALKKIPVGSREYRIAEDYINESLTKNTIESNIRQYGDSKYGTTDSDFVGKPLQRYLQIDRVERESQKLTQKINKYDFLDIDQVKKIEFTERDIGIFSFDLASLGLVRVYEYYSPLLKATVNPNFVVSEKTADGKLIFFYVGNPFIAKHEIQYSTKQGGYYSDILKRLVSKDELVSEESDNKITILFYPEKAKIERHEVERVQVKDKNGKDKFATTFKKCFINIPKVENTLPRIDIIVPISYAWRRSADDVLWNAIPLISICEKLTASNVDYRVIGAVGIKCDGRIEKDVAFINIKNENQPLDKNQLSMIVSDMRFFRLNFFRLAYAMQYDSGFGNYFSDSIGAPMNDTEEIKTIYMDYLSKQNSETDRVASLNSLSKLVLPVSYTENEAELNYNKVIKKIASL